MDVKEKTWDGVSYAAAAIAGFTAVRLLERAWEVSRGREAPEDPAADDVTWPDALAWAVASGAVIGLARLLARRGTTAAWRVVTEEDPPSLA